MLLSDLLTWLFVGKEIFISISQTNMFVALSSLLAAYLILLAQQAVDIGNTNRESRLWEGSGEEENEA